MGFFFISLTYAILKKINVYNSVFLMVWEIVAIDRLSCLHKSFGCNKQIKASIRVVPCYETFMLVLYLYLIWQCWVCLFLLMLSSCSFNFFLVFIFSRRFFFEKFWFTATNVPPLKLSIYFKETEHSTLVIIFTWIGYVEVHSLLCFCLMFCYFCL